MIRLELEGGRVAAISIGAGGVAATPARAVRTEALLLGRPWTQVTVQEAMDVLRGEFTPLSDMRASAAYRSQVLGNLLQRFWLESQGMQQINLESFVIPDDDLGPTMANTSPAVSADPVRNDSSGSLA